MRLSIAFAMIDAPTRLYLVAKAALSPTLALPSGQGQFEGNPHQLNFLILPERTCELVSRQSHPEYVASRRLPAFPLQSADRSTNILKSKKAIPVIVYDHEAHFVHVCIQQNA